MAELTEDSFVDKMLETELIDAVLLIELVEPLDALIYEEEL
jgi:hypothetical protein